MLGALVTAGIMIYIGLVIVGLYAISPKYIQSEIMEKIQSIGGN